MLRGRDCAQLQDGEPSSCKESQELKKGSLASSVVRVILYREHLHFLGATTRTVSTAEITQQRTCWMHVVCRRFVMVESHHAMGVLSAQMKALANVELVQNGRALISRLSECTAVQWRHVASHAGNVYNELAERVAALASRGGVVSAIGPLPRRETRDASQWPCPMIDGAERFWTSVMMKPDPKLFEHKGRKRDGETNGDALGLGE